MTLSTLLILLLALAVVAAAVAASSPKRRKAVPPAARRPLTPHEQLMYFRLRSALPEHIVLAQVSFGALLDSKSRVTRNTFDRKIADFVVCEKSFRVLAVIELDDSSHRAKVARDRARDAILETAGYRVLRYPRVPDESALRRDFIGLAPKVPTTQ